MNIIKIYKDSYKQLLVKDNEFLKPDSDFHYFKKLSKEEVIEERERRIEEHGKKVEQQERELLKKLKAKYE